MCLACGHCYSISHCRRTSQYHNMYIGQYVVYCNGTEYGVLEFRKQESLEYITVDDYAVFWISSVGVFLIACG